MSHELALLEIALKRNLQWVDAALDQGDERSFVLACQERARLNTRLDRLVADALEHI